MINTDIVLTGIAWAVLCVGACYWMLMLTLAVSTLFVEPGIESGDYD